MKTDKPVTTPTAKTEFDLTDSYKRILEAVRRESSDPLIGIALLTFCKHFLIESLCDD